METISVVIDSLAFFCILVRAFGLLLCPQCVQAVLLLQSSPLIRFVSYRSWRYTRVCHGAIMGHFGHSRTHQSRRHHYLLALTGSQDDLYIGNRNSRPMASSSLATLWVCLPLTCGCSNHSTYSTTLQVKYVAPSSGRHGMRPETWCHGLSVLPRMCVTGS